MLNGNSPIDPHNYSHFLVRSNLMGYALFDE